MTTRDDAYNRRAEQFFNQYQSVRFEDVHHSWQEHLPPQPGFALDVGAGSGRDALALAARGWDVLAVEPAKNLRCLGQQSTQGANVQWSDDRLPELTTTRALSYRFNLILVSAVWMHLPPTQRERAFRILSNLLAPGGILVITLRHGPGDGDRTFFEVNLQELEHLARNHALVTLHAGRDDDRLARSDVWWESAVFRLPDDGTGALPTLRHVIVNDDKSSTYKLGLLRTLCLIADALPGMVLRRTDEWVELPLGIVGMYWLRLYEPLVLRHNLRQTHGNAGLGFAKDAFYRLSDISPFDRRVGRCLSGDAAVTVLQAIRDACQTILKMPAHYTTWPGSNRPIFEGTTSRLTIRPQSTILDKDTLARFGTFRIPDMLWDCFSRYACWLEPAITGEWVRLMQRWEGTNDRGRYYQALNLDQDRRDTSLVRQIVDNRLHQAEPVQCVWTAQHLRDSAYEVDHCLPWSRWNNNDLWNLFPTTRKANNSKSEKLPSAPLVQEAKGRILKWWDDAYIGQPFEEQFFIEAEAALPLVQSGHTLEAVFEGLLQQRLRLKVNQQLAEWAGVTQRQASEYPRVTPPQT